MKHKTLLVLSATMLTLCACNKDNGKSSSSSIPAPELVEVDFATFKAASEALSASPYDKVSAHYVTTGYAGQGHPLDIDKTVTLTKVLSEWKIDVAPTHVDYACATQVKEALANSTFSKLVKAYDPTDPTATAKFYYHADVGFKMEASASYSDESMSSSGTSVVTWNKYGDLTLNDSNSVEENKVNPEYSQAIHCVINFTYSSTPAPEPGDDDEYILGMNQALEATKGLTQVSASLETTQSSSMQGGKSETSTMVLDNDQLYLKNISRNQDDFYEVVIKKDDKYVNSKIEKPSGGEYYRFNTSYVDANHAHDLFFDNLLDMGLTQSIEQITLSKSFDKYCNYLVSSAIVTLGISTFTENDYTKSVIKKEIDGGVKQVTVAVQMKSEWCQQQTFQDMPVAEMKVSVTFEFTSDLFKSFSTEMTMAFDTPLGVVTQSMIDAYSIEKGVNNSIKEDVIAKDNSITYPEEIYNAYASVSFYVNDYQVYSENNHDYTDDARTAMILNSVINSEYSDLRKILNKLGDSVNVKYLLNGVQFTNFSGVRLSSYENRIDIAVTPKDSNKCAVLYCYNELLTVGYSRRSIATFDGVVVDKSTNYQIVTNGYTDMVLTPFGVVTGTTYDISKLDTIVFECTKNTVIENQLNGKNFVCQSIQDFEQFIDTPFEEELPKYIGSTLSFESETFSLDLVEDVHYEGMYNMAGTFDPKQRNITNYSASIEGEIIDGQSAYFSLCFDSNTNALTCSVFVRGFHIVFNYSLGN